MSSNSTFFDNCMQTRDATPPTNAIICNILDGLREYAPSMAAGTFMVLFLYLLLQRCALQAAHGPAHSFTPKI